MEEGIAIKFSTEVLKLGAPLRLQLEVRSLGLICLMINPRK